MSDNKHVPDGKTQRALFHTRSRARTAEIQRRNHANQTLDEGYELGRAVRASTNKALHEQSVRRLNNAEATIVALLQHNIAFQETIERLTEAWGENQPQAMERAEAILEEANRQIQEDTWHAAAAKSWAKSRMAAEQPPPVAPPTLKRRGRKR